MVRSWMIAMVVFSVAACGRHAMHGSMGEVMPGSMEAAATGGSTNAAEVRVIDVMPLFFAFWDEDRARAGNDTTELLRLFRERVIEPHAAFFERAANGAPDPRILNFLAGVPRDLAAMRTISTRLAEDLDRYRATFADSFPDFRYDGSVYFYPSLYQRDGGTMNLEGSVALMFGIDMIARIHGPDSDLGVLFAHELFHLYHSQVNPSRDVPRMLYWPVWREGLATYVSGQLNPGSDELSLLLNDQGLLDAVSRLPELAARLRADLDTGDEDALRPYLQAGASDPVLPARAGYLLGYRVASELGRTHSVRELAILDAETVRREMENTLERIAASAH